jgi:hypothetical protein
VYYNKQNFYQVHSMHAVGIFHFNPLLPDKKSPVVFYYDRAFCSTSFLLLVCFTQSCYGIIICCFTKQHSMACRHKDIIPADRHTSFCYLLFTVLLMHLFFLFYKLIPVTLLRFFVHLYFINPGQQKTPLFEAGLRL